jgi:hypothetical protein
MREREIGGEEPAPRHPDGMKLSEIKRSRQGGKVIDGPRRAAGADR